MGDLVDFPDGLHRSGLPGFFSLAELPQRQPIAQICKGISAWGEFSRIFKFYPGQFVVVTGVTNHGKSTFILNALCKMAREHGTRTFAYVPENEGHLRDKLSRIWQNDKTFERFAGEYFFVQSSVPAFNPKDAKSLWWVLKRAEVAINDCGCSIVLIDPWNELDRARPRDQSVTDYIGECLMMVKDFCRTMDATVIMVGHPTKAVNEGGGRVPGLYDIEGSANWANKCDNGLVVWRDMETGATRVISNKVREAPDAGVIGAAFFHVDPQTGIFTPQVGVGYE